MKKVMITLMVILTTFTGTQAMSYEQARREALFLTDKMAYELNLTDEQYNAAYEINLDYLMGVTGRDNVFGTYWERRNLDFSYILLDWQYQAFCAASYFYRPLYWDAGYWHFGIYACYPRTHFYFARPTVYISYRGGHSWHRNGGRSFWKDQHRTFNHGGTHRGMRDNSNRILSQRNNRNDNRNATGNDNRHGMGNDNRHGMGNHNSSTRITVNGNNRNGNVSTPSNGSSGSRFGGVRSSSGTRGSSVNRSSSSSNRSTVSSNRSSTGSRSTVSSHSTASGKSSGGNSGRSGGGSFGNGRR